MRYCSEVTQQVFGNGHCRNIKWKKINGGHIAAAGSTYFL